MTARKGTHLVEVHPIHLYKYLVLIFQFAIIMPIEKHIRYDFRLMSSLDMYTIRETILFQQISLKRCRTSKKRYFDDPIAMIVSSLWFLKQLVP